MAVNRPYQGQYRTTQEDDDLSSTNVMEPDNSTVDDSGWKKRYGDLRSYNNQLTKQVKELKTQLDAAMKKERVLPSTPQEIEMFARQYPDVFRAMQTVSLTNLKEEREIIKQEIASTREDLNEIRRDKGFEAILDKHKDFYEINQSEDFLQWAEGQPQQIQDWLFESDDPLLCIRGLDLYKADLNARSNVAKRGRPRKDNSAADAVNPSHEAVQLTDTAGKRIWKISEIAKLRPAEFDKYEQEIDQARREGRLIDG